MRFSIPSCSNITTNDNYNKKSKYTITIFSKKRLNYWPRPIIGLEERFAEKGAKET